LFIYATPLFYARERERGGTFYSCGTLLLFNTSGQKITLCLLVIVEEFILKKIGLNKSSLNNLRVRFILLFEY
jgi:hypothetical protein